ncbi:DUF448 domain-containing protein [Bradyrhizobium sp. RDI18]|uniref:DUF448 domain-containing protein n=1 Tax=Bradyrhizobium sp. RDI18 TaxID=3367400 RepID=UPI00371A2BC8
MLDDTELDSGVGPKRLCAVTRESRDAGELIRWSCRLDGIVVPDLDRRLPGRGVWVGW